MTPGMFRCSASARVSFSQVSRILEFSVALVPFRTRSVRDEEGCTGSAEVERG